MTRVPGVDRADSAVLWPPLPLDAWRDTYATLHMWMQIVGKVCLALTPLTNHFWNIAFRVTPRGLTTPSMTTGNVTLTMTFDFIDHQLLVAASDGRLERLALAPCTVAEFYRQVMDLLQRMGVSVRIWTTPVEIPDPVPFERDTGHRSYDRVPVEAFRRILLSITPVLERFRAEFIGKGSPVHFFWGAPDLAVTRFSGRVAPEHPGGIPNLPDRVTREAYSHEVSSAGFWAGGGPVTHPVFYSYAYPQPDGFSEATVRPREAYWSADLKEFLLPYDAVRTSNDPDKTLLEFLQSTYEAAASLGKWDLKALER